MDEEVIVNNVNDEEVPAFMQHINTYGLTFRPHNPQNGPQFAPDEDVIMEEPGLEEMDID
jgi:hypothetical protein